MATTAVQNCRMSQVKGAEGFCAGGTTDDSGTGTDPIDKQTKLVAGKRVPLLDAQWVTPMRCIPYEPPPPPMSSQSTEDAWQERCKFLSDDLHELLAIPHWLFWCQAVNDASVVNSLLDSFLRLAPRWYDECEWRRFSEPAQVAIRELHRLVFLVCLRLSTHKESKDHWISEPAFADLHASRIRLFTPARLLDLCALYYPANRQLVSKLVVNLLRRLPRLAAELSGAVSSLGCRLLLESASKFGGSISCPTEPGDESRKLEPGDAEFRDRLLFARDALETLAALEAAAGSSSNSGFSLLGCGIDSVLPELYESAVVSARHRLATRRSGDADAQMESTRRAGHRLHMLCLDGYARLWAKATGESASGHELLIGLSQLVHCRRFLAAIEEEHGFKMLLDRFRNVDPELCDYISKAVDSAVDEFGSRSPSSTTPNGACAGAVALGNEDDDADEDEDDDRPCGLDNSAFTADDGDTEAKMASVAAPDGVQFESLVSHVQDIFPGIGCGFVKECLIHYAYDTERLINALLEDSLPPALNRLDRDLLIAPSVAAAAAASAPRHHRQPGSSADPFDRLDREGLRGRLHRGKRERAGLSSDADPEADRKMRAWLEDWQRRLQEAEDEEAEAELLLQQQQQASSNPLVALLSDDDEYDDTYDGVATAAPDAGAAGSSEEDNTREDNADQGKGREEANGGQQQQQQQRQVQSGKSGRFGDVKGTGKRGRGQSHQVVHNRQAKERDKGHGANHNRRWLADRKRAAGGMF